MRICITFSATAPWMRSFGCYNAWKGWRRCSLSARILKGKTHLEFCVVCHKVHVVGKWQKITKKIEEELRKNFGKWQAELIVCPDCRSEEVLHGGGDAWLFFLRKEAPIPRILFLFPDPQVSGYPSVSLRNLLWTYETSDGGDSRWLKCSLPKKKRRCSPASCAASKASTSFRECSNTTGTKSASAYSHCSSVIPAGLRWPWGRSSRMAVKSVNVKPFPLPGSGSREGNFFPTGYQNHFLSPLYVNKKRLLRKFSWAFYLFNGLYKTQWKNTYPHLDK